jgi:UDP-glucose 4-epimerase
MRIKKSFLVVTGGAGFVGSNMIKLLLKKTKFDIISIDNYSSGHKFNHIKNKRIRYFNADTQDIKNQLKRYNKLIHTIFHFGEFSRIYQSFKNFDKCLDSNVLGSKAVFDFCLKNKIKLIYSATSATLGNNGKDQNLSPYAFTKSKNLELLENLKKWFNFKFEVIYFYNVYGPGHIKNGDMSTVIGIFESQYENNKPLTVVKPGTQSRRFTHINDTIEVCYYAWKRNKCCHYSVTNKVSYTILEVARLFKSKIRYIKSRLGERSKSALTNVSLNNKIVIKYGRINLKDYITSFIKQ